MDENSFDFVIVGAGAAGLTAAQYGARSGLRTLLLDSGGTGGQALNISELENFPGVFPATRGAELIEIMEKQAAEFGAEIRISRVKSIDKINGKFSLETDKGTVTAGAVLIATGAVHRELGAAGEKEFYGRGVSYCATCDGPFFRNKKIIVVGGGDSALSEALYLTKISDDITLIHRRDEFRAQKVLQDRVKQNAHIKILYNSQLTEIKGNAKVESAVIKNTKDGTNTEISCDGIFIFVGIKPNTSLVDMLKKDEAGYLVTDESMRTSAEGIFAAGDVRSKPFRQIVTAASDGAIAAHAAHEYLSENNFKNSGNKTN